MNGNALIEIIFFKYGDISKLLCKIKNYLIYKILKIVYCQSNKFSVASCSASRS
jgi:hypothetical protein